MRAGFPCALFLLLSLTACGEDSSDACAARCRASEWIEVWSASPSNASTAYADQTLRLVLTPLRSGDVLRVRLSNRLGATPITFGRVAVGIQSAGAGLVAESNREVRFAGGVAVSVPAGAEVVSDPVAIQWRAFERLAVSVYVSTPGGVATEHSQAHQTSFVSEPGSGDLSAQRDATGFSQTITSRPFLSAIEARVAGPNGVLVAVGDSITDGDQRSATFEPLGIDEDSRYPDFLARRLQEPLRGVTYSVLNQGISGNQVLDDAAPFAGPSLLSRLDADVLGRAGVTDVVLLEGINDLGFPPTASAADLVAGLEAAVNRLKAFRGGGRAELNVLVGTLTPSGGTSFLEYGSAETNAKREEVNRFLRDSGIGDGVVDFDRALRDPAHPERLLPLYDSGDHLHPSSAGYQRMAEEVDPSELMGPDCRCP